MHDLFHAAGRLTVYFFALYFTKRAASFAACFGYLMTLMQIPLKVALLDEATGEAADERLVLFDQAKAEIVLERAPAYRWASAQSIVARSESDEAVPSWFFVVVTIDRSSAMSSARA